MDISVDDNSLQAIENDFYKIANQILNRYVLQVIDQFYRVTKIEFYYYNHTNHLDCNTHAIKSQRAKERQKLSGQWYLHKKSINKNNKYKGLDFTFGDGRTYGGILIKEVMNISTKKTFSQSNFVNELINHLNPKDEDLFLSAIEQEEQIRFVEYTLEEARVKKSPRKKLALESFKDAKYAFSLDCNTE